MKAHMLMNGKCLPLYIETTQYLNIMESKLRHQQLTSLTLGVSVLGFGLEFELGFRVRVSHNGYGVCVRCYDYGLGFLS